MCDLRDSMSENVRDNLMNLDDEFAIKMVK